MADVDSVSTAERERYEAQKREFFNACTSERNRFIEAKAEESKAYDQAILTFSAGAIGVSLTFVEKIAPEPTAPTALYISWICFGFAILAVVISFLLSQAAMDREIRWVDEAWDAVNAEKTELPPRRSNRHTFLTRAVNLSSGALFVAGIGALIFFGGRNWPRRVDARRIEARPLQLELRGEIMPNTISITTATPALDTRGNISAPAFLPTAPQVPSAPAPTPTPVPSPSATTTTNK